MTEQTALPGKKWEMMDTSIKVGGPSNIKEATMSLHTLLCKREEEKRPIGIGMVGAGRYGTMFLAQSRFIPGMEVLGIADLDLEKARAACVSAGWSKESVIASNSTDVINDEAPEEARRDCIDG